MRLAIICAAFSVVLPAMIVLVALSVRVSRLPDMEARDRGHIVEDAVWRLWVRRDQQESPCVVALRPGGEALPGEWTMLSGVSPGGAAFLRGTHIPREDGTVASGPDLILWRGGQTISDPVRVPSTGADEPAEEWVEFLRRPRAADFARLGCDPALVGKWSWWGIPAVELRADGVIADDAGTEIGRWAGRDGLVIHYLPRLGDWMDTGIYVSRVSDDGQSLEFVLQDCEVGTFAERLP